MTNQPPRIVRRGEGYVCSSCGGAVRPDAERCEQCKVSFRLSDRPAPNSGGPKVNPLIVGLVLAVLVIGGTLSFLATQVPRSAAPAAARSVTIDGRDATGIIVDPINLWDNYQTRARVVARVKHGDRVTLVREDGNGALVRTSAGAEGWLTKTFIQELR